MSVSAGVDLCGWPCVVVMCVCLGACWAYTRSRVYLETGESRDRELQHPHQDLPASGSCWAT